MNARPFSYWRYSPLSTGVLVTLVAFLIRLVAASMTNSVMPKAWLIAVLIGPSVGIILHLASTRVLFGRFLDLAAFLLLLVAMFVLASAIRQQLTLASEPFFWAGGVGLLLIAGVVGFIRDQRSWLRAQLPCGYDGQLDKRTGRVDPYGPTPRQPGSVKPRPWWKNASVQTVAGIVFAQLVVRLLPDTGKLAVVLLIVMYMAVVFAFGAGRVASVCLATWHWERQHGKQIHVARR